MSYFELEGETRQQKEIRLAAEYDAYVIALKADGKEPTNYMNWLASKKYEETNGA